MRVPTIAALGIAAYLVFLAATVPASYVVAQIREPVFSAGDAHGTIWKGSARALVKTPNGGVEVDRIHWRFRPSRLLAARLAYDVEASSGGLEARARLERGLSMVELRDLEASGDAQALALFTPLIATWQPEGAIRVTAPMLSWDRGELRGEARAEWRGAAVLLSQVRPLGSYRAELQGSGGAAKVTLTTIEGPLRLAGEGTLSKEGRFAFTGEARGEGSAAASLDPLLDLIGPRRADGARPIRWPQ